VGDGYLAQHNNDLGEIIADLGHEAMAQWIAERRPDLNADAHDLALELGRIITVAKRDAQPGESAGGRQEAVRKFAQQWDENTSQELSDSIIEALEANLGGGLVYHDSELRWGDKEYKRDRWAGQISDSGENRRPGLMFLRLGYLFFFDKAAFAILPEPLRKSIDGNAVLIDNLSQSFLGRPSADFTLTTLIALMNCSLIDKHIIETGAGDGVLSLAAWRMGASSLTLVDIDKNNLRQAKKHLELNGLIEGNNFHLLNADLKEGTTLAGQLKKVIPPGKQIAIVTDLGTSYQVSNSDIISFVKTLDGIDDFPPVTLFIAGGYGITSRGGSDILEDDLALIRSTGFLVSDRIAYKAIGNPSLGLGTYSKERQAVQATGTHLEPKKAWFATREIAGNSDVQQATGGIDFRSLPIVTQAVNNLRKGTPFALNPNRQKVSPSDLAEEWWQIEKLVTAGIAPSSERIKEYIQAASSQDSLDIDKVVSCISDILRQEEEGCCSTEPALRDILVVLEAGMSSGELKRVLVGEDA
jgi:hypothetical protein